MTRYSISEWLIVSSLIALAAPYAQAQEQPGASAKEPGDQIVVTARRREENAQTVPVSVTAFNSEMLREKAIVTTQDLTYTTPGLNVAAQTSRDTPSIVIRGQRRLVSGSGAPSVVTYFADVPLPNMGSIVPTYDVASIQVLKGPQGTLFGRNTIGGALLLYPEAPSYGVNGYGQVTLGSYHERTIEGAVNVPIIADRAALRVAGQMARRDGYTKNHGIGGDLDDRHTDSFRASLLLEPADGLKNVTILDYYRARENGTGLVNNGTYPNAAVASGGYARSYFAPFFDCGYSASCDIDLTLEEQKKRGIRDIETSLAPYSHRTIWGIANTTTLDAGSVSFKNIFGYRQAKISSVSDYDGSALTIYDITSNVDTEQYSDEFQISGKSFSDQLDWIVGAFYLKTKPRGLNGAISQTLINPYNPRSVAKYSEGYDETESKALFAQIGYAIPFLEGLRFNGGFRYTWDKASNCAVNVAQTAAHIGADDCASAGGSTSSGKSKAPTWTVGLDYQASRDLFLYVVNRRGYRAAGPNRSGLSSFYDNFRNYEPETLTDFEAGLKSDWRVGEVKGRFNIAAYTGKYKNIQRGLTLQGDFDGNGDASDDPISLVINAAEATIRGAEFDFMVTPSRGFSLSGFGAYTDAKFDAFDAIPQFLPLLGTNPVNNKFSYTPKWTLGGNIRYAHEITDVGELVFNANWFHSSKVWYVERPLDTNGIQKAYDTVNLKLDLNDIEGRGIDLGIFVRNLFDVEYATAGGVVTPSIASTSLVYNEPRIWGVQLRMSFGER